MSHQFKPGDMALTLVEREEWPAFCVVSLHVFVPPGVTAIEPSGFKWTSVGEWVVYRDGDPVADAYLPHELMPLRGDFVPEQQKAKEAEPCA
nr:hypothetical protein [uncultured Pseudomonas sp.]